jgi:erythromycin esterase-like protein
VAPQAQQADKFVAKLLQNRYDLSVRSGQLSGAGAQVLQSAIAQSRFVLLGEDHGIAQTSEFWAAVCRAAGPSGFHTMAVEEGPLAAAELERWARRSRLTQNSLNPQKGETFCAFRGLCVTSSRPSSL